MPIDPITGLAVLSTGLDLYDRFFNPSMKKNRDLMQTLVQNQFDVQNQLFAESQGNFTPGRIRQIRQDNEHRVNRVALNTAQRGLGTSEAGLDFITEAQERPFEEAQRTAALALPGATQAAFTIGKQMIGDDSFTEDLGHVVKLLTTLKGFEGGDMDPVIEGAIGDLAAIADDLMGDLGGPSDKSVGEKLNPKIELGDRPYKRKPELGSIINK